MIRSAATSDRGPESIEATALHHFARMRSGDRNAQAELDRWLEADPLHTAAYEELRQLWSGLEPYRSEPSILEMREEALRALRRRRQIVGALVGLAASVVLTVGIGTIWISRQRDASQAVRVLASERQWSTRVGQTLTVALSDGSTAVMDTASTITVRIGQSGERRVTVTRGRALFEVAKLPGRPFVVAAGPVAVTALGTKFDVYHRSEGVDVNLIEGRLRVEEAAQSEEPAKADFARLEMAAGDKLQVRRDKWLLARGAIGRSTDWANGQLVFEQTSVSEIVEELSRYTDRKLVIADSNVGNRRVSAVIRTDNPLMFLDALKTMHVAQIRQLPNGYLIASAGL